MIKASRGQTGSAQVVIITILIVAILVVLGFVFWQNFIKKDVASNIETTTEYGEANDQRSNTDRLTYRNDSIGIEFTYPKDWIKVECDDTYIANPQNRVYFGTNEAGLGIVDGSDANICGGGTDFPPQMAFEINDNDDEYREHGHAQPFTVVEIDGIDARKSVTVGSSDSIPPGLERTQYVVDINDTQHVVFSYARFPDVTSDPRDNSEASRQMFIDLVENSLKFL